MFLGQLLKMTIKCSKMWLNKYLEKKKLKKRKRSKGVSGPPPRFWPIGRSWLSLPPPFALPATARVTAAPVPPWWAGKPRPPRGSHATPWQRPVGHQNPLAAPASSLPLICALYCLLLPLVLVAAAATALPSHHRYRALGARRGPNKPPNLASEGTIHFLFISSIQCTRWALVTLPPPSSCPVFLHIGSVSPSRTFSTAWLLQTRPELPHRRWAVPPFCHARQTLRCGASERPLRVPLDALEQGEHNGDGLVTGVIPPLYVTDGVGSRPTCWSQGADAGAPSQSQSILNIDLKKWFLQNDLKIVKFITWVFRAPKIVKQTFACSINQDLQFGTIAC